MKHHDKNQLEEERVDLAHIPRVTANQLSIASHHSYQLSMASQLRVGLYEFLSHTNWGLDFFFLVQVLCIQPHCESTCVMAPSCPGNNVSLQTSPTFGSDSLPSSPHPARRPTIIPTFAGRYTIAVPFSTENSVVSY